jgi:hypothetical protein
MQLPRLSRAVWIPLAIVGGLSVLLAVALLVVYPRVGAKMIREKLASKVERNLGRALTAGTIDVSLGHAVIRDVVIRGPNDGIAPLVHVEKIEIDFDTWASLIGNVELGDVTLDGVHVSVRRGADGRDNVSDIVERLRGERGEPGSKPARKRARTLPASLRITRGRLLADDAITGATAVIGDGEATWRPGELVARARNVSATTIAAPRAAAAQIDVRKLAGAPPTLAVSGGEIAIFPRLALSGITGTVIADPERADHYVLEFAGGYGGVPGNLWTAKGGLDTAQLTAAIDLEAAKFQLDRLAPILEKTPVVDYKSTSVDTKLHLELDRDGGRFSGELHLSGLNVGHPLIADKEVHGLDLTANIDGTFSRSQRRVELVRGDFQTRGVPFSVTGAIGRSHPLFDDVLAFWGIEQRRYIRKRDPETGELIPQHGPGGIEYLQLRLVIPPLDCQRVLAAFPEEMAPYLVGYKLRGMFDTDVRLDIDWGDLDSTRLDGHVGIRHCKVRDEPEDSPKRLEEEFEHYVEVEKGQWISFVVGPSNEDFVPIEEISPYLIKSIMTTEDSAFYRHRGFITSEFRTALVNDLKAGRFKYGASSITMQMVKNVLLYREKTLARKLQELFLTWHVENTLTKDRILEIYFNVIEYGPGLYGIGPAARHFFGKAPKDLNPVEAAFFSSILPAPKERYKQYCANTLTKWTDSKIKRILALMLKRERLTQAEYDLYSTVPLAFVKDGSETEEDCLKRVKKAIKNARSTNPLKR